MFVMFEFGNLFVRFGACVLRRIMKTQSDISTKNEFGIKL